MRLQKEVDEAIRVGVISSPITAAESKTLPYLQVSTATLQSVTKD